MSPSGATSSPNFSTSWSRISPVVSSSRTTASLDSVAAPRRSSALSASDLPAAMPPVRPTNGTRALGPATGYAAGSSSPASASGAGAAASSGAAGSWAGGSLSAAGSSATGSLSAAGSSAGASSSAAGASASAAGASASAAGASA